MKKTKMLAAILICTMVLSAGCSKTGNGESETVSSQSAGQEEQTSQKTEESVSAGDISTQDAVSTEENKETKATDAKENDTTDSTQESTLSEEDIYWNEVLESFKDSKYDLTDILTEPALKDYVSKYFTLGVGINGSTLENQTLNVPEYMAVSKKHFNSVTMTNLMKSCYILDQTGSIESLATGDGSPVLNFASIDPTLSWCMENGMKMRGHTLVWHAQAPEWFFREGYKEDGEYVDKETMLFRMESYIKQMLTHVQENFPGVIYCWDVVNEAVDPDKGDKDSFFLCRTESDSGANPWYMTIGEEYVEMAFTYARKYADKDVKLFYNDFNTYMTEKRNAIIKLCESLNEKGLIDGIGMQGYWGIDYPGMTTIENTIRLFARLGLEIQITELSISVDEENEEELKKQADAYGSVFIKLRMLDDAAGGPANITNVTFFGLIDHYREGDTTNTRLLDSNYQLKPAFKKVRDIFKNAYKKKE